MGAFDLYQLWRAFTRGMMLVCAKSAPCADLAHAQNPGGFVLVVVFYIVATTSFLYIAMLAFRRLTAVEAMRSGESVER